MLINKQNGYKIRNYDKKFKFVCKMVFLPSDNSCPQNNISISGPILTPLPIPQHNQVVKYLLSFNDWL